MILDEVKAVHPRVPLSSICRAVAGVGPLGSARPLIAIGDYASKSCSSLPAHSPLPRRSLPSRCESVCAVLCLFSLRLSFASLGVHSATCSVPIAPATEESRTPSYRSCRVDHHHSLAKQQPTTTTDASVALHSLSRLHASQCVQSRTEPQLSSEDKHRTPFHPRPPNSARQHTRSHLTTRSLASHLRCPYTTF